MVGIDKQIESARQKPLTVENLNYIGDLFLKKGDRRRAIAYFFEAVDKLHFAQKEKKIAIYKKIIKIDPYSEKAYLAIIEIMSKMDLVMEEKKYLHMLAKIYEERGDKIKSEELYGRIRHIDRHLTIPGTSLHNNEIHKVETGIMPAESKSEEILKLKLDDKQRSNGYSDSTSRLIEASIEPATDSEDMTSSEFTDSKKTLFFSKKIIIPSLILLVVVFVVFVIFRPVKKENKIVEKSFPAFLVKNGYEISISKLDSTTFHEVVDETNIFGKYTVYTININSINGCIPDAFASNPYNMIMLLNENGGTIEPIDIPALKKKTKKIFKTNICNKDEAVVFTKIYIAAEKKSNYSGIALKGLNGAEPILIKGD